MSRRPILASTIALVVLVAGSAVGTVTAQAGGGCHVEDGNGYNEGTATVVRMDACSFEPTVLRVPVGTTVRFLNTAPNDHAVNGRRNKWGSSDILVPGAKFSEEFSTAGVYPYACPLHPGMVGAVVVGDQVAAGAAAATAVRPAPAGPADPLPAPQAEAIPIAAGAAAGFIGGSLVGLLGAGVRRRAPSIDVAGNVTGSVAARRARRLAFTGQAAAPRLARSSWADS